jgi:Fe-S-cluster containining protein
MSEDRSVVPCNGCVACCKHERIVLYPEHGDDPSQYETVPTASINPKLQALLGAGRVMLAHKPNGECIYLGEAGCTIWDRAPNICKMFDCRKWFLKFTRAERRKLLAQGHLDREVTRAGAARVDTLTDDEMRSMVLIHGITDDHR